MIYSTFFVYVIKNTNKLGLFNFKLYRHLYKELNKLMKVTNEFVASIMPSKNQFFNMTKIINLS